MMNIGLQVFFAQAYEDIANFTKTKQQTQEGYESNNQHYMYEYVISIFAFFARPPTPLSRRRLAENCVLYSLSIFDAVNGLHRNALNCHLRS